MRQQSFVNDIPVGAVVLPVVGVAALIALTCWFVTLPIGGALGMIMLVVLIVSLLWLNTGSQS
jgi:hypothetical protein